MLSSSPFSNMSFRAAAAILAVLGVLADRAVASLILHEGDVFTYEFNSLPDALYLPPGYGGTDGGGFSLRVSEFDWQQDVLRFEMFEDNLGQPNFFEAVVEAVTDGGFLTGTWADNQGVVRLTMEAGEVSLDQLMFMHQVPLDDQGNIVRYIATVEPVPEPSTMLMLVCGPMALLMRGRRERSRRWRPQSATR
jgi:hypothetical protein